MPPILCTGKEARTWKLACSNPLQGEGCPLRYSSVNKSHTHWGGREPCGRGGDCPKSHKEQKRALRLQPSISDSGALPLHCFENNPNIWFFGIKTKKRDSGLGEFVFVSVFFFFVIYKAKSQYLSMICWITEITNASFALVIHHTVSIIQYDVDPLTCIPFSNSGKKPMKWVQVSLQF